MTLIDTTRTAQFFVPGEPAPGGSKSAFALRCRRTKALLLVPTGPIRTFRQSGMFAVTGVRPIINMTDDGKGNKAWRKVVSAYARRAMLDAGGLLRGDLSLTLVFHVERPKSHYGTGAKAATLKASAPQRPGVKPDLLKLARSTEDAMTGIVYEDDAQIVEERLSKVYGRLGQSPGCWVTVEELE